MNALPKDINGYSDIGAVLHDQWDVELQITKDQESELHSLLYTIGVQEMNDCIEIVSKANIAARSVRYLMGVIKRRQQEKAKSPSPTMAQTYVYHRCDVCCFVNKVRRDVLQRNVGKGLRCGGVDCNMQWKVEDLLKQYERA